MIDIKEIPWDEIKQDLLDRYSGATPRYTSYPTAPEWSNEFGSQDYEAALLNTAAKTDEQISIYVHIPFCKERCLYCGCASWLPASDRAYDIYLNALKKEVQSVAGFLDKRRSVRSMHFGGGTPTTLSPKQIEQLCGLISEHFSFADAKEIAVEVNPAVTSFEQVEVLSRLGFNRMSIGVQDFTPEVQQAVKRIQSVELTLKLFEKARLSGFRGINIDLMYGLPKQRLDTWAKTLEEVIKIGPDRLAVFGYAHVPWMRHHQKLIDESDLPDTSARFELFKTAHESLTGAGYVYIGMDHFAKPTDDLTEALLQGKLWRNFQGYTTDSAMNLIGLGVTAISDIGGVFAQNLSTLEEYQSKAESNGLATFRGMKTSADDQLRRKVITELMCNLKLDVLQIENDFKINFWKTFALEKPMLEKLEADGLVRFDKGGIEILSKGRIFVRHVGMVFDVYSRRQRKDAPRFSRTV